MSALATEDPRYFDLAASMKRFLLGEAAKGEEANEAIQGAMEKLKVVQKRFRFKGEGEGPIARVIADRIRLNETNLANNVEVIGYMRAAARFVEETLEYQTDPRPPVNFTWSGRESSADGPSVDELYRMLREPPGYARFHEFGTNPPPSRPKPPPED